MKIIVIGGGVVGVTTAYYLAKEGASVTLLERQASGGLETSAGNAGLISPSDSFAWASPSALKMALRSVIHPELGIQFRAGNELHLLPWSLKFLNQCRPSKWRHNSDFKFGLARRSLELMKDLQSSTGIEFDALSNGIVYACREASELKKLKDHFGFLEDRGLSLKMLDTEGLIDLNPALNSSPKTYAGAVYSPGCMTGDSRKFSEELSKWCVQNQNCKFEWNANVEKIEMKDGQVLSILTSRGEFNADAYVLSAGSYSAKLARQVGVKLPIYPIKGFSISAPITNLDLAPVTGFDDVERLVAVSTLGNRLRIASSAVFEGYNLNHSPRDFKSILKLAKEIFPEAADYDRSEYWVGLRPMTPSSVPIIGATRVKNFFVNAGHGHLGWTMACGSGRMLADTIFGKGSD